MKKEFTPEALLEEEARLAKKRREEELLDELNEASVDEELLAQSEGMALDGEIDLMADAVANNSAVASDASEAAALPTQATGAGPIAGLPLAAKIGLGVGAGAGAAALADSGSSSSSKEEPVAENTEESAVAEQTEQPAAEEPAAEEPAAEEAEEPIAVFNPAEDGTVSSAEFDEFVKNNDSVNNPLVLKATGLDSLVVDNKTAPLAGTVIVADQPITIDLTNATGSFALSTTEPVTVILGDQVTTFSGGQAADTVLLVGEDRALIVAEDDLPEELPEGIATTSIENVAVELLQFSGTLHINDLDALEFVEKIEGVEAPAEGLTTASIPGNIIQYYGLSEVDAPFVPSEYGFDGVEVLNFVDGGAVVIDEAIVATGLKVQSDNELTIIGDVASIKAAIAAGTFDADAVDVIVRDTRENLQAAEAEGAFDALPNVEFEVEVSQLTVAEAIAANVTEFGIDYAIADTAANLALAPSDILSGANSTDEDVADITVLGTATVAELNNITLAKVDSFLLVALADKASNLANYVDTVEETFGTFNESGFTEFNVDVVEASEITAVTVTDTATAAQAAAIFELFQNEFADADITLSVADVAGNISEELIGQTLDITVTDAGTLDVSTVSALLDAGVALNGTFNVIGSAADMLALENVSATSVANIIEVDGSPRPSDVNTLVSTFGDRLFLTIELNTNSQVALYSDDALAAASSISLLAESYSADNILRLLDVNGENVDGDGESVLVTGTVTIADYFILIAANANPIDLLDLSDVVVADTVEAFIAAIEDGVTDFGNAPRTTDIASAEQSATLTESSVSHDVQDSVENLLDSGVTSDSPVETVTVTDAVTVAVSTTLLLDGDDSFAISDESSNVINAAVETLNNASSVTVTDSVDFADAVSLVGLNVTNGIIFSIADGVDSAVSVNDSDKAAADAAQSVVLTDTVANINIGTAYRALADELVAKDSLDALVKLVNDASGAESQAQADAKATLDAITSLTVVDVNEPDDAANLNKLVAAKTADAVFYAINLTTELLEGAAPLKDSDLGKAILAADVVEVAGESFTVAQVEAQAVRFGIAVGTFNIDLVDSITNLVAAPDVATDALTVSITDTVLTVASATSLLEVLPAFDLSELPLVDTTANIQAYIESGETGLLTAVDNVRLSDKASLEGLSVAEAVAIFDQDGMDNPDDGSFYADYSITDSVDNLANSTAVVLATARLITAVGEATVAEILEVAAIESVGDVVFDNVAVVSTASDAALSVTDLSDLDTAGVDYTTLVYSVEAAASNLIEYSMAGEPSLIVSAEALINAAEIDLTGVTSVQDIAFLLASGVSIETLVYDLDDSYANLADADAAILQNADSVVDSGTNAVATAEQAALIAGAVAEDAALTLNVSDDVSAILANLSGLTVATSVVVTDNATASQAAEILAAIGADTSLTLNVVDTAAAISQLSDDEIAQLNAITVTDTADVALAQRLSSADTFTVTDTWSNLLQDGDLDGADAAAALAGRDVTITDDITVRQYQQFVTEVTSGNRTFNLVDSDENLFANVDSNVQADADAARGMLLAAQSVTNQDGVELEVTEVDGQFGIIGNKADLDQLSELIPTTVVKYYRMDVAEFEQNFEDIAFGFDDTQKVVLIDSYDAIVGNENSDLAVQIIVSDAVSVAEFEELVAIGSVLEASISDTAANLAASLDEDPATLDAAETVTATTAATLTEALAGTFATSVDNYDIEVQAGERTSLASGDALDNASNIVVLVETVTVDNKEVEDPLAASDAELVIDALNSGSVSLPAVEVTAADLSDLLAAIEEDESAALAIKSINVTGDITDADVAGELAAIVPSVVGSVTFDVADVAEALVENLDAVALASSITVNGDVSVADIEAIVDSANIAANKSINEVVTYSLVDTAEAILAVGAVFTEQSDVNSNLLVNSASAFVEVEGDVSAEQALDLINLYTNNQNIVVFGIGTNDGTDDVAGLFTVTDTLANINANLTDLKDALDVESTLVVSDDITVAQFNTLNAATDLPVEVNVADTAANILAAGSGDPLEVDAQIKNVTATGNTTVAQALELEELDSSTESVTYNLVDTAAAISANANAFANASSITATGSATFAQAMVLLDAGIAVAEIKDDATAIADAFNSVAGRNYLAMVTKVTAIGAEAATLAEAIGTDGDGADASEARGIYEVDGITFDILDTDVAALNAAFSGNDSQALVDAGSITVQTDTIDVSKLTDRNGRELILDGENITLNATEGAKDIVVVEYADVLDVDDVTGFSTEDSIDLDFVVNGAGDPINNKFGQFDADAATKTISEGLTVADTLAAIEGATITEGGIAYILVNATDATGKTGDVELYKVENAVGTTVSTATESTLIATFNDTTAADFTADNFEDFVL